MALHSILWLVVAALSTCGNIVGAISGDDSFKMQLMWLDYFMDCNKEYDITMDDWKQAGETRNLDEVNYCALACVFKKSNYMDENGMFDTDYAKEDGLKYFDDIEDQNKFVAAIDDCSTVNEESVSDGTKGCEMAKLMTKCFMKYTPDSN